MSAASISAANDAVAAAPGAAPAAAGSERQPGALGGIPRPGGAHALRRGVHRASRHSRCPPRSATRWPKAACGRPAPALPRTGRRRSRLARSSSRPSPPSRMAATRSTSSMPPCCPWRARAWPDRWTELNPRPVILSTLGRLRHRRPHRHRLVGHVAAAAGDEAPAACAAARPARRAARRPTRSPHASPRRWTRSAAQLAACPDAPDPPRVAAFAQTLVGQPRARR